MNVYADRLFVNGVILTQDEDQEQVSQMAVTGNHIVAVGNDLNKYRGEKTQVHDLEAKVVVPGFLDAHLHFLWGGEGLRTIQLNKTTSKQEFMDEIRKHAQGCNPGSWLKGGGWNEHHHLDRSIPHKSWLDEAAPGHPMILTRHDGHSGVASSAALSLAGITKDTPHPEGGVIDHDAEGELTGILRDAAMGLVKEHRPLSSDFELEKNLEAAQTYLLQNGVTAVGDMIHDMNHFRFLQDMARQGKLRVRVSAYTPILHWAEMKALLVEGIYEDEWFQFKGLKGFCDGSLGSHTALMLEPYEDAPDSVGIYDTDWSDPQRIENIIAEADEFGLQVVIHAIGDRANREVLDIFEKVMHSKGERDRRFRIEHAQHIHPDDQPRFAELGIIPSVQPKHCIDDSLYGEHLLGDRCRYAYPFQTLQDTGALLAFGSDWSVSPADPLATIHAAVHRNGWYTNEAMRLPDSLRSHTRNAAFAGKRDHDLGVLKSGYLADFVVLHKNYPKLALEDELSNDLIDTVYVNGAQV